MSAAGGRRTVVVIHGPNLNLLGKREPATYGSATLQDIDTVIRALAKELDCDISTSQHSSEGDIIDAIHAAAVAGSAIVINPGAYTHYSYAIRDALAAVDVPKVEVHLSNVHAREEFRRVSVLAPVVHGVVAGFGANSYLLGIRAVVAMLDK
ncbi:MAG TPA: type II 3-dehydroquinate dehydratase [Candidatus Eremiobacteraceae bacterium]|nr:type II 3-dehydroquinate dehydratase [Candidatus Eremiobacteraceae bacterium]